MGLDTSPEKPAPVRQIANLIAGWVDRLGPVWVEGQVAQLSRRQGMNTVFLTLRDAVADVSVPVTCSRQLFDSLNPPVVEGASIVVHAKPSYYANRGTLSLRAADIRMVGLGELLARIERRRQLLAAEGLFAQERKRPLPFLPRCVGLVTGGGSAAERDVLEVARRRWPAVEFRVLHTAVQGTQRRRRGDGRAGAPRPRRRGRRDRDRAGRRLGRGPAALLRRGTAPRRVRRDDTGRLRDRSRARQPAARPGRRPPRGHAHRRGQDRRPRRRRGDRADPPRAQPDPLLAGRRGWTASGTSSTRCAPGRASPTRAAASTTGGTRSSSSATGRDGPCTTSSTGRTTTSPTSSRGSAACPRWRPCGAATPSCRTPTAMS